jgi:hypothetical protein
MTLKIQRALGQNSIIRFGPFRFVCAKFRVDHFSRSGGVRVLKNPVCIGALLSNTMSRLNTKTSLPVTL